ncbi:MAG: virulence RhuM family protein [Candidatus Delongbacteria bacterium]|jgi:hypothetical protein|nr:virulence RhuM family protein [Candidatus Delongbacteria bacterium]
MKKKNQIIQNNSFTEFILYTSPNGKVKFEVFLRDENIWLTQKRISELFGVDISTINEHLKNIYKSDELNEEATVGKFPIVQTEGNRDVKREVNFYNLDAIISVGYRVNSNLATQFRIWATERLKEYIIKGFTMDDERLKNPQYTFGKDYFEEQLARIRDIRSSERRFYQKITDIYAQCSADYIKDSEATKEFFAKVQNKLHWAITKQTAAEIIHTRADGKKKNMGLTNWKNSPQGVIRKTDVSIAKNYLNENELENLNRIVTMYLDYADLQAQNRKVMYMKDWIMKLDGFLQFNEKEILQDSGKVTAEIAKTFAESELKKYKVSQDKLLTSDFDNMVKEIIAKYESKR